MAIFDMLFNSGLELDPIQLYAALNYLGILPRELGVQDLEKVQEIATNSLNQDLLDTFVESKDKQIAEFGKFLLFCIECIKVNKTIVIEIDFD